MAEYSTWDKIHRRAHGLPTSVTLWDGIAMRVGTYTPLSLGGAEDPYDGMDDLTIQEQPAAPRADRRWLTPGSGNGASPAAANLQPPPKMVPDVVTIRALGDIAGGE